MKKQILLSAAAVLALASSAYATSELYVSDGSSFNTVAGVGGSAVFSGVINNWVFNVDTGQDLGNPSRPNLDLGFVNTFNGASSGNTITVAWLVDGFNTGAFSGIEQISATLGATAGPSTGWTFTSTSYAHTGSTIATTFGTAVLNLAGWSVLTPMVTDTGSPFATTSSGGILPPAGGNPYEVMEVITITAPTGGGSRITASGDVGLTVPDGGSTLMLLGSGLTALGLVRRSIKRKA